MPKSYPKNQDFKTSDIFVMAGLVGLVATLSGVVLARSLDDERPMRTQASAEALSLQLAARLPAELSQPSDTSISTNQESQASDTGAPAAFGSRGPASISETPVATIGDISRDPWGHPFHYHVSVQANGRRRVIVWSDGPNHASDSDESIRLAESANLSSTAHSAANPAANPVSTGRNGAGRVSFFRGDDIGFVHEE